MELHSKSFMLQNEMKIMLLRISFLSCGLAMAAPVDCVCRGLEFLFLCYHALPEYCGALYVNRDTVHGVVNASLSYKLGNEQANRYNR